MALLHGAAVLFMLTGSLLALRWPRRPVAARAGQPGDPRHLPDRLRLPADHLGARICASRRGEPGYTGGFIGHYITEPLGFPIEATSTQLGVYALAFLPNLIGYGLLLTRRSSRSRTTHAGLISIGDHPHCGRPAYSKECSGPGKTPPRTSSAYSFAARSSSAAQVGVLLHELRHPAAGEPGHVRPDQHLGVAVDAGADADRRDGQLLGHLPGDLGGHHLQDDGERPGLLHGVRVGEQLLGAGAAALHPVAAERVLALRREPDVAPSPGCRRRASSWICGATRTPPSSLTACAPPSFMQPDGGGRAPARGPDS